MPCLLCSDRALRMGSSREPDRFPLESIAGACSLTVLGGWGLARKGPVGEPAPMAPATLPRSGVSTAAMALMKSIGTVAVTVFVFGIVVWWLIVVLSKIGIAPTVNSKGAVTVDQYQRAKDILHVFFP